MISRELWVLTYDSLLGAACQKPVDVRAAWPCRMCDKICNYEVDFEVVSHCDFVHFGKTTPDKSKLSVNPG